jgi:DNA-binding NarL/FixJ family response regulator
MRPPDRQPTPIRVLIVDDDDGYASTLSAILTGNPNFRVVGRAADGVDGIAAARRTRPDVVVLDVNMPRLDGFEASRAIRDLLPHVRIVILTGAPQYDHASRARVAGANVYLPKDVDLRTLADVLTDDDEACGRSTAAFALPGAT